MSATRSTLQVIAGALRAACEEMGAVLVRTRALGEHQGAPRLLDRAVRRRRRDGHAGRAHPGPPRRDAGRRRAPCSTSDHADGRLVGPQRPLPRRHPPARHHRDHARRSPTASCSASPPSRAHHADVGGARAGLDARGLDDARRGGRRHRAARARRRRRSTSSPGRCASPRERRADLRAQLAANRIGVRAARRAGRPRRADALREAMAAVLDYAERRTRACLAALDDGTRTRRRRARGARGRPRAARSPRRSTATS